MTRAEASIIDSGPGGNGLQTLPAQTQDGATVAAILGGDDREPLWKDLWARHAGKCFRIAARILRSESDAWEAVNLAWAKAFRELSEDIACFEAWIATLTKNQAIDLLRQSARRASREGALAPWDLSPNVRSADPETSALAGEAAKAIVHCTALSEDEREAFLLRALGGMSYDEISRAMDRPVNSVSVFIHRARNKLKDLPHIRRMLLPLVITVAWLFGAGGAL